MRRSTSLQFLVKTALLSIISVAVQAGPILQVSSITSDKPLLTGHPLEAGINQSGLSSSYISGSTDFDTYVTAAVTHDNLANTTFATSVGTSSVSLIMDLGGTVTIESLALWNRAFASQGVKDFSLVASTDAFFTTETLLGSFTAQTALTSTGDNTLAEVFSFGAINASFVRMDVTSTYGSCCVSFGELAFEQSANVPEPGPLALLGLGFAGIAYSKKRKKTS